MEFIQTNAALLGFAVAPNLAMADVISCDLSGTSVRFEIDRTQFAPARDQNEPSRRSITTVQMGNAAFSAEPFIIGDTRGFWTTQDDGAEVLLVMQPDGRAVYSDTRNITPMTGTCEVLQ